MESAGVPVVPGYHGDRQDAEVLRHAAETMGYPGMARVCVEYLWMGGMGADE